MKFNNAFLTKQEREGQALFASLMDSTIEEVAALKSQFVCLNCGEENNYAPSICADCDAKVDEYEEDREPDYEVEF